MGRNDELGIFEAEIHCEPGTIGEQMIDMAEEVLTPRDRVALVESCAHSTDADRNTFFAKVRTSLDFYRKPKVFQLEAMVEGWSAQRINRELY